MDNYRYSWLSPRVIRKANSEPPTSDMTLDDLIPLETKPFSHDHHDKQWPPKLVIGHNVGFDRSFIKEQYYIEVIYIFTKQLIHFLKTSYILHTGYI